MSSESNDIQMIVATLLKGSLAGIDLNDSQFSTEIRWFLRGAIPLPVKKPFDNIRSSDRRDLYRIDHIDLSRMEEFNGIGIKWRQGNLEAKIRRSSTSLKMADFEGSISMVFGKSCF